MQRQPNIQFFKSIKAAILVALIALTANIKQCLSQETDTLGNNDYQLIRINNLYEIQQNQTALTIKLNLTLDNFFIQNYIVIDVILVSELEQPSKFVACLNFAEDPLLKDQYINGGYYTCDQTDIFSTEKQKQQHLLVISIEDPLYQTNRFPFLTFFYQQNTPQRNNTIISQNKLVRYDVFAYNFNQFPCHNNCNGKNGYCNGKDGTCTCKENYMDEDCGIFLQPLTLFDNNDSNNLMIQSYKAYFYKIQMNNLLKKAQNNHIYFHFKKYNLRSVLDIQIFNNTKELPSNEDKYAKFKMQIDEFSIKNVEYFCQNLPLNQNLTSLEQNNQTMVQDDQNMTQECFIILKVRQIRKLESTILQVSVQIQQDQITDQKNEQNKEKQVEKESASMQVNSNFIIGIFIAIIVSTVLLILGIIKIILKAYSNKNIKDQNKNIPKIIVQTQVPPKKKSVSQIIKEVNNKIQIEQKKKTIFYKKRLLQYFLMPVQQYENTSSDKELKNNYNKDQKEKEKSNNFDISIELYIQKQYENIENLDESIGNSCKNQDKQQMIDKNRHEKKKCQQNEKEDVKDCQNNQTSIDQKLQDQNIPTTLQVNNSKNKQCCSLCLVEFVKGQKLRITICSHYFHSQCLEEWLESNENCPLCRQSFEIMDMIDYISVQLYSKVNNQQSKQAIGASRNYVNSRLQQEQEKISQLSNREFLTIFKEYIPDFSSQIEYADQYQLPNLNKKSWNKNKFQKYLNKKTNQEIIDLQVQNSNQNEEKQQTDDNDNFQENQEKITENENRPSNYSPANVIFSKQRASLNQDKLGQYSASLAKSCLKIESKQKKLSNSQGLIPSSSNLSDVNKIKEKLSSFNFQQQKFMYKTNVTQELLKENQDNIHTRMTSIGLESQPNYLIKQSTYLLQNDGSSQIASPMSQNTMNFRAFMSKQPSFYDIKADTSSPEFSEEDSANNFQNFLKNPQQSFGEKLMDEIEESPNIIQKPSSLKNINYQLRQNSPKNTTSLRKIEINQNKIQLNFYKKPKGYQNIA
ncbi:anaphase-promoting complex subunit 11 RING-H2 finger protein (macronuclear) [Tetrahymena thermophila SB210]|uniref:Anaphase-promoting complex subunit 11 RING-H2 finger protein n=1 Tax=Tetrahymena thermophila (strain SB210) TaxID=312017 RepID=I7M7P9_TETTS|nr:anaphase-promoting complex subunit 11 RING-H2 finger protein [Tetrahymena thermophila SB210]EAR95618.2 anaphase-promoting complex subunit 11 RING-H2 finger protein [Tetrahymena thermophila SB210]|eukprot:XP_001015863.2 anaphase-promoting complex subunit 11 RING-H2 finger protein [Tetrahymena thermophila SB210]